MLLPDFRHRLIIDPAVQGPECGLLPIGRPCNAVTTTGLKWNLNEGRLAFGDFVSSSNKVAADAIEVVTDAPLVWTIKRSTTDSAG